MLAGGLVACSSGNSADPSEPLVVYSGRSEELVKPLYEKFTQQTGIQVDARYGDSADLSAQAAEEGQNSPAQVFFSQDAGAIGVLDKLNLLAPLPASVATTVPEAYRSANWTGVTARSRSLVYNPEVVSKAPPTVFDLAKPEYKGKVAIAPGNASFQSFVTSMRLTEGDAKTEAWLEGLVANDVQKFEKNSAILEAVDAGKAGVGLVNHYYWYALAKEKGAENLKVAQEFTEPGDPGSFVNVASAAVTANNADNQNAASFLEFLLSKETQEYFATETFEYPLVSGVNGPDGAPPISTLPTPPVELNELADLPATQKMLQDVGLI